jgi:hypothetical protein
VLWQAHLPNGRAGVHSDEVGQGFEAPCSCANRHRRSAGRSDGGFRLVLRDGLDNFIRLFRINLVLPARGRQIFCEEEVVDQSDRHAVEAGSLLFIFRFCQ